MHDPNENRPGYTRTAVGWIPSEWEVVRLEKAASRARHAIVDGPFGSNLKSEHYRPSGIRVIQSGFVTSQRFTADRYLFVDESLYRSQIRSKVVAGDIVMAKIGAKSGTCAILPPGHPDSILAGNSLKITPNPASCDTQFLVYVLHRRYERSGLLEVKSETAQPAISLQQLKALPIPLPPLPEQEKIAEMLSTWDDAIEQTRDLIAAKKQQKKALMQQLLTGKRRLPGFEGEWTPRHLSSLVVRIKETADDPDKYPVLSITAGTGFVSQADKFSRVIAGKHIENYILLRRGEFSYNKGNSYRYPQGCVYQLHEYDEGLVPSVFYSFRVKAKQVHDAFLKHYFIAGLHNPQLYRWINTGVRNNGLLNLNASDFFNIDIALPDLPEQRAIATVLDTADTEIKSLQQHLEALQQQKKGLMQRLLAGQVRVKV